MSLATALQIAFDAAHSRAFDLVTPSGQHRLSKAISLADGTGLNQADRIFSDERTLAASATEDLDLAGGSLVDIYGQALTFARIKILIVEALSANTNNVNVSRPAANGVPWALAAGDGVAVAPGEAKVLLARTDATGIVVTAGTGDLITLANSAGGTTVTYRVVIVGASA